jgi:hypothetical protein
VVEAAQALGAYMGSGALDVLGDESGSGLTEGVPAGAEGLVRDCSFTG